MGEVMRDVEIRPYVEGQPFFRLQLIDTGQYDKTHGHKRGIGYRLAEYDAASRFRGVIFAHETHGIVWSPGVIDDDEAVGNVLGWLTLRPGDTDAEFFKDYTERQLEFANQHAESLGIYAVEWSGDGDDEDGDFEGPPEWGDEDAYEDLVEG